MDRRGLRLQSEIWSPIETTRYTLEVTDGARYGIVRLDGCRAGLWKRSKHPSFGWKDALKWRNGNSYLDAAGDDSGFREYLAEQNRERRQ
jgi:hypothetical protein